MLLLNSVHPFGLNDRVEGAGYMTLNKKDDSNKSFQIKLPRRKRSHGTKSSKPIVINTPSHGTKRLDTVTSALKNPLKTFSPVFPLMSSLKTKELSEVEKYIRENNIELDERTKDMIEKFLYFKKRWKNSQPTHKSKKDQKFVKVEFVNKAVDLINPTRLSKTRLLFKTCP